MDKFPTWEQLKADPVGKTYVLRVGDGLAWMVRRGTAALCAYVGVPPDSPLFGKSPNWADDRVEVHGGFTWPCWADDYRHRWNAVVMEPWTGDYEDFAGVAERAAEFQENNPVEYEGRFYDLEEPYNTWWWFGWDYGHAWDETLYDGVDLEGTRWTLEMVIPQAEEAARAFSQILMDAVKGGGDGQD